MSRTVHAITLLFPLLCALAAHATEIRGVIAKVDADKKEVVLEARNGGARGTVMIFVLDKDSRILVGQQPGQFGMLAPGKHIRLIYETRDGKNVVQTLHVNALVAALAKLAESPPAAAPAAPAVPADPNAVTGKLQAHGHHRS